VGDCQGRAHRRREPAIIAQDRSTRPQPLDGVTGVVSVRLSSGISCCIVVRRAE
jgi:hypothetical protein